MFEAEEGEESGEEEEEEAPFKNMEDGFDRAALEEGDDDSADEFEEEMKDLVGPKFAEDEKDEEEEGIDG